MALHRDLTDTQWTLLEPFFSPPLPRPDGLGRPWRSARLVLNSVFFILRTGCAWADLPRSYPPRSTVHDRFQWWIQTGAFQAALEEPSEALLAVGLLDRRECFIDGSFATAKQGGLAAGKTKKGKGTKIKG